MTQTKHAEQLEILPKSAVEKLDTHERNIRTYIKGSQKGAGELFGYAYLAGQEMLQARSVVPNGNARNPNAGFKNWVQARFPKFCYRTAARWMQFAESIEATLLAASGDKSPPSKSDPGSLVRKQSLTLTKGKLTVQSRASILAAVVAAMDGKTMRAFMQDSRLLRDPEPPQHHDRKPVSAEKLLAAKKKQALSHWTTIINDLALGSEIAQHLETDLIQQALDNLVTASNALRELLKSRKSKPSTLNPQPSTK